MIEFIEDRIGPISTEMKFMIDFFLPITGLFVFHIAMAIGLDFVKWLNFK